MLNSSKHWVGVWQDGKRWEGNRDSFKEEMMFELGLRECLGFHKVEKGEKVILSRGWNTTIGVKVWGSFENE